MLHTSIGWRAADQPSAQWNIRRLFLIPLSHSTFSFFFLIPLSQSSFSFLFDVLITISYNVHFVIFGWSNIRRQVLGLFIPRDIILGSNPISYLISLGYHRMLTFFEGNTLFLSYSFCISSMFCPFNLSIVVVHSFQDQPFTALCCFYWFITVETLQFSQILWNLHKYFFCKFRQNGFCNVDKYIQQLWIKPVGLHCEASIDPSNPF